MRYANRSGGSRLVQGFVVLVLSLAASAAATDGVWTGFGPGGGSVTSLAVDPGNPAVVYAVAGLLQGPEGTLYRSADGGATWKALVGPRLTLVALDPAHPSTLYAAGVQQVVRSADGGGTWSDVSPPGVAEILALAVGGDGAVFASNLGFDGESRLWRSADGGVTWSLVATAVTDEIRPVVVDPTDPGRVYYASGATVYKSVDGGVHWTAAGQVAGLSNATLVRALAVVPTAPSTLYLALFEDSEIFRSDDGAATWRRVGTLPGGSGTAPSLALDPRDPDRLYLASDFAGIFTSLDGGRTWRSTSAGLPLSIFALPPSLALAVAPSQPDTLYAGTSGWGVARSTSGGARWRTGVEPGLNAGYVALLKFHPSRPQTVYVALDGPGDRSFRSTDGGASWQPFAREISLAGLSDLAFDPADPDTLYAANQRALWKSTDGGGTWSVLYGSSDACVALTGGRSLLACGCGLGRSTDGGHTWKQVLACAINAGEDHLSLRSLWADPRKNGAIYAYGVAANAGSHFGFVAFRSQSDGARWTRLRAIEPLAAFGVAPGDFRVLYAVSNGRLLRSGNGGTSWTVVNPGPLDAPPYSPSLAVDGADPDQLYVGTSQGALVSRDGGRTLTLVQAPFEAAKRDVSKLWTDRTRPGRVYASSLAGGLFEGRFDASGTFTWMTVPAGNQRIEE
ncbi:MAG TPA: hypothetical protein VGH73_11275 [Thermoanaerobaculia bacterium]|jgi:photosystem II stability/assembly factor-like uncharacterized protein